MLTQKSFYSGTPGLVSHGRYTAGGAVGVVVGVGVVVREGVAVGEGVVVGVKVGEGQTKVGAGPVGLASGVGMVGNGSPVGSVVGGPGGVVVGKPLVGDAVGLGPPGVMVTGGAALGPQAGSAPVVIGPNSKPPVAGAVKIW